MSEPVPKPEAMFSAYKPLVEGFEEALPMLLVGTNTQILQVTVSGFPEEVPVQQALASIMARISKVHGTPNWVVFSTEAYMLMDVRPDEQMRPGYAQRQYEKGDERAREVVQMVCVTAHGGDDWTYVRPFIRRTTPVGKTVVWGSADQFGSAEGGVPDVIRAVLR